MKKALEILEKLKNIGAWEKWCLSLPNNTQISEAISELEEAMKPKTCEGCFYDDKDGVLHVECAFCLRNSNDNFKPKDTQC